LRLLAEEGSEGEWEADDSEGDESAGEQEEAPGGRAARAAPPCSPCLVGSALGLACRHQTFTNVLVSVLVHLGGLGAASDLGACFPGPAPTAGWGRGHLRGVSAALLGAEDSALDAQEAALADVDAREAARRAADPVSGIDIAATGGPWPCRLPPAPAYRREAHGR
jgi:hypothetical protein